MAIGKRGAIGHYQGMSFSRTGSLNNEWRAAGRFRVYAALRIIWPDAMTACQARLLNISDCGAAVAPKAPLAYGALVHIDIRRFHMSAAAYVRRCTATSSGYFAALEFVGPLQLHGPPVS